VTISRRLVPWLVVVAAAIGAIAGSRLFGVFSGG
jgi:hypothetical protein